MTKTYDAFFEKFPMIHCGGERLVWDTRQVVDPGTRVRKFKYPEEQSKLAAEAAQGLGHPSKNIRVWGVTGTNGKSSTVEILRHLLVGSGRSVLQLGTLGLSVWKPENPLAPVHSEEVGFTTPLAPQLQWILRRAVDEGLQEVVMEVSSHALAEGRSDSVHFDCAIFTNLTRDHLDFHKTMENYFDAKARLFTELLDRSDKSEKLAVINVGSEAGKKIFQAVESKLPAKSFAISDNVELQSSSIEGVDFLLEGVGEVRSSLIGNHNVENLSLALMATAELLDVPVEKQLQTVASFRTVKGRLERVEGIPLNVFVDYAHTPDALEKVLKTLQELKPAASKLWVVFGCGGDRDAGKRPLMGIIADENADCIVVTSDNPRTEEPAEILRQIQTGISPNSPRLKLVEVDRRRAIEETLTQMNQNDICLIAGKGHEEYQIIGTVKSHFSDAETVKRRLGTFATRPPP